MTPRLKSGLILGILGALTALFISIVTVQVAFWVFVAVVGLNVFFFLFSREVTLALGDHTVVVPGMERAGFDLHAIVETVLKENPTVFSRITETPEITINAGMSCNAFSLAAHPSQGLVSFNSGLLQMLELQKKRLIENGMSSGEAHSIVEKKLAAVAAHELGHINNLDSWVSYVSIIMTSFLDFLLRGLAPTEHRAQITPYLMILLAPTALLAALRREREYMADEAAFRCGYWRELATVLYDLRDPLYTHAAGKVGAVSSVRYNNLQRFLMGLMRWLAESFVFHPLPYNRALWVQKLSEGLPAPQDNATTLPISSNWSWYKSIMWGYQQNISHWRRTYDSRPLDLLESIPEGKKPLPGV